MKQTRKKLSRQFAQLLDILTGGINPFLFQPVRYIHRFDEVIVGLGNLINCNHRVVVNFSDGLCVLPDGRGVGSNHVTEEFTGPLGSFQDSLLPGEGRLNRQTDGQDIDG